MKIKKLHWGRKLLPLSAVLIALFVVLSIPTFAYDENVVFLTYDSSQNQLSGVEYVNIYANGQLLQDGDRVASQDTFLEIHIQTSPGYVAYIDNSYSGGPEISISGEYLNSYYNSLVSYLSSSYMVLSLSDLSSWEVSSPSNFYIMYDAPQGVPIDWNIPSGCTISNAPKALVELSSFSYPEMTFTPAPGYSLSDYEVVTPEGYGLILDGSTLLLTSASDRIGTDIATPTINLVASAVPTTEGGIIQTVLDSIVTFITGIGESFVEIFDNMVVVDGELSPLAIWGLVFIGLGFSVSVVYLLFRKFT